MKRISLLATILSISCALLAQKREFVDYLDHCRPLELPFVMTMDSTKKYFPSIGKQDKEIPDNYIHQFICMKGKPCDDDPYVYRYDYGAKVKAGDFIIVFLNKLCYECSTEFGIDSAERLMLVYTPEGKLVNSMPIFKSSEQHFYNSKITKCNLPDCVLLIQVAQGTLLEEIGKSEVYKAIIDDFVYTVNENGKVSFKKVKTEKVKAKASPKPPHQMEVIETGW